MKFSLTIHDLTADGVQQVMTSVTGGNVPAPAAPVPAEQIEDDGDVTIHPPIATVETDKNGMPWDERIHSSSKAINKDGTWKYRRGVEKELIATVEAELSGGTNIGTEHITEATTEPDDLTVRPAHIAPVVPPTGHTAPIDPPTAPQPAPAAPSQPTFEDVSKIIAAGIQAGWFTMDNMMSFNQNLGISNLQEINGNPEKVMQAFMHLQTIQPAG